jgi:DNA-binding beta-propeller fold protein YncE
LRLAAFVLVLVFSVFPSSANAELMIIGNDEKYTWDDAGSVVLSPPGKDTISIVDISNREAPKILVNLSLMNTIVGPPVNLAITPDERLAIVANSLNWAQEGAAWKPAPDNKLYVIDLKASPPKHIATVEVGKQPSGLSINARGDLALVANREDKSISVLSIQGTEVKLVDTVAMGDVVAHVAFTPDGKHALAVKFPNHKVAVLNVEGQKVTYAKYDIPVGSGPTTSR